jgi:hypothetical protein
MLSPTTSGVRLMVGLFSSQELPAREDSRVARGLERGRCSWRGAGGGTPLRKPSQFQGLDFGIRPIS